ncbi:HupE/UreJ family protein [Roseospirillum parvum]|uniref:Urease accessory protein n=1 Tax=Roseospirillum parvum TaxID=83401 RepID=A0A1G8B0W6_9PROT|nr:HupE/UreJ family protein [Roseospirillum parvum]SDH26771.1 urease accessory protein [Roseospirillum parvum]
MIRSLPLVALLGLIATPALAHTGVGPTAGLASGFGHPIGGLDHLLAMVAVGLLAAQGAATSGRRALWAVPAAFVGLMVVGGVLGMSGLPLPMVELGIVGSVLVLGVVIALGRHLPLGAAMALVGALAIFHGHAHGTEMPLAANGLLYGLGFALATSLLHAAGIGLGLAASRLDEKRAPLLIRVGGGAIATAGLALMVL